MKRCEPSAILLALTNTFIYRISLHSGLPYRYCVQAFYARYLHLAPRWHSKSLLDLNLNQRGFGAWWITFVVVDTSFAVDYSAFQAMDELMNLNLIL
jgi:hypothetical protein